MIRSKPALTPAKNIRQEETSLAKPIPITKLIGLPVVISACSCCSSKSDPDFKNENFLFAHNYEGLGLISLNKKAITLKLVNSTRVSAVMINQNYQETYVGESYTANETWWNKRGLTIIRKGYGQLKKQLVGECGC